MKSRCPDGRYPNGHFYSPVLDPAEVEAAAGRIWPSRPEVVGIDFNPAGHRALLRDVFPPYLRDYDYPQAKRDGDGPAQFVDGNPAFAWLDSRALFVLLRHWRPRRIVEVGSGHSSLLMADVNRRFLGRSAEIRCIEPYPPAFLAATPDGIAEVLPWRVQDLPLETFADLEAGDVLFIDSSHVSKTGSDVNHLFFEVIPRLAAGVRIHFHDVFLPFDYPRDWVLGMGLYWNEQYLLQAMLTLTPAFRVLFGSTYASVHCAEENAAALSLPPGSVYGGSSFWIEKTV